MAIDDLELAALIGTRDLDSIEAAPPIAININDDVPPFTGTGDVDSIEATQLTADNISDTVPPITVAISEAELDHGRSHNVVYSVLQARNHFFEVVKQTEVIPQPAPIVSFAEEARMYAIKTQPNFVHYLAQRTDIPENALLHICSYNPLIDPYLTEIYQNFQKGVGRENLLLIIFPPLANFNACFQTENLPWTRTTTKGSAQFVRTLSDYEMLLLQMTSGIMRRLVFVLPIDEDTERAHAEKPFEIWMSTARILGESNCVWHSSS